MCRYCYTSRGKEDRFKVNDSIAKLNNDELEEIIEQFGNIGGKVIFICSEGEPLFYIDKFIKLADLAKKNKLRVITYTNTTKITNKWFSDKHFIKFKEFGIKNPHIVTFENIPQNALSLVFRANN